MSTARVDVWIARVGFEVDTKGTHEPPDARRRSKSAAALLTELAAARARLPSEVVRVEHDDQGRPVIASVRSLHASVGHSADYVACAVSTQQVGIDIETCERPEADSQLAERVCTVAELGFLSGLRPDHRSAALVRLWTRKEAVVKALGTGFAQPLERTDVLALRPVIDGTRKRGVWIRDVERCPTGYAVAVAGCGRSCVISVRVVP